VGEQLVSVNNDFSVARCAGEAIVSAYPNDGFGCCLMASRTGNFDALIVEEMFGHYSTTDHGLLDWTRATLTLLVRAKHDQATAAEEPRTLWDAPSSLVRIASSINVRA